VTTVLKDIPQQEFETCFQQWHHRWASRGIVRGWSFSVNCKNTGMKLAITS
jgi:hypothetical protein